MIPLLLGLAAIGGMLWFASTPSSLQTPTGPVPNGGIDQEVYVHLGRLPGGPLDLSGLPELPGGVGRVVMRVTSSTADTVTGDLTGALLSDGTVFQFPVPVQGQTVPKSAVEAIRR